MLLHEITESAARHLPAGQAVWDPNLDRWWTFTQLHHLVTATATGLNRLARPGAPVAVVAANSVEMLAVAYGSPWSGHPVVFGNTRLTPMELARLLAATRPSVLVGTGDHVTALLREHSRFPSVRTAVVIEHPAPPRGAAPRSGGASTIDPPPGVRLLSFAELVAPPPRPAADLRQPTESDPAWLVSTSGTTGRPKSAVLTHRSLLAAVTNTAIARPLTDDDVYLFPFPLFHVAAYNVLHAHLRRRPVVLTPGFDAEEVCSLIAAHRVTSCSLAPTMISMLVDHPGRPRHDLGSLRSISYGASAIGPGLLRRGMGELGCDFAQGYGMTELSGNAVFLGPAEHRRAVHDSPHLLASAGRPGPLVQVRVIEPDGTDCEPGTAGEIVVHGDQTAAGYWEQPEETAAMWLTDPDGRRWLRTGDVGRFDPEGHLYIVDRLKDIVVTGGENVSSREVEDIVADHPDVANVAVVGVPHERWGEQLCAVVTSRPGQPVDPDALISWCRPRLAGFKRPKAVVVVDELPLNASGKVVKPEVRRLAAETLGRSGPPTTDPTQGLPQPT